MYLEQAIIQNFRGIESLTLNFCPGVNLLIGDNGAGKTSALEALCVGLGAFLRGVPGVTVAGFQQDDFREVVQSVGDASQHAEYLAPSVTISFSTPQGTLTSTRSREDRTQSGTTSVSGKVVPDYAQSLTNTLHANLPIVSYMSISRVIAGKRSRSGKKQKKELLDRRKGYISCLDSIIDKNNISQWLQDMSYEAFFNGRPVRELELFHKIVSAFMQKMCDLETPPSVRYNSRYKALSYRDNNGEQPISYLSAGYQSLLWMVMDLAVRLASLNPELNNPADAIGIVLIDEIDMHLHPKWQWNILSALQEIFPKIQFIAATHSPIIIASCKNGYLIRLDDSSEPIPEETPYAYSIQDVVSYVQGSKSTIPALKELYHQFEEAVSLHNLPAAEMIGKQIQDEYPNSSEVKKVEVKLSMMRRRR